jgi:hypothetical protein
MDGFLETNTHRIELGAPSGCWLWSGAQIPEGYGSVHVGGKVRLAHRLAYECANGQGAANGLYVRHKCDTPACINPAHLVIGTPAENSRDAVDRGRMAKGERVGGAKLCEADVRAIRSAYVSHSIHANQRALARRYGVDQGTIRRLLARKTWRHVL